jgi:5-methylcytosine-specific restriction protein A
MRKRLTDFAELLPVTKIDLGFSSGLPGDYEAGHALGITYEIDRLPQEPELRTDLETVVSAYRKLTFRGGLDASGDVRDDLEDEDAGGTLYEKRQYRLHRRIERNRTAARRAKQHHGTRCQACELDFAERYGDIGEGFIEAHHLRPISSLNEGVSVVYEVATDFAVLCANCHRMIHRMLDPSDLRAFRDRLRELRQRAFGDLA